jgi:hypothetical protein
VLLEHALDDAECALSNGHLKGLHISRALSTFGFPALLVSLLEDLGKDTFQLFVVKGIQLSGKIDRVLGHVSAQDGKQVIEELAGA